MLKIYSIGFTKKNAKTFFESLINNQVKKIIDVRLNNTSQLAGFAKGNDLKYFLGKIAGMGYEYEVIFAPTKVILDAYKKGDIDWMQYEEKYIQLMKERKISEYIEKKGIDFWESACLLCSEETPDNCHRRLAINEIIKVFPTTDVHHIIK
ncbi:MAG TPA: DUF488 domain-containing protein [Lachnospiraceae bacterium]|jgi:uncharacterized protein (DUF488 family)|nr:DUF488 domain-containing protein [Lachnospiraceae bacterium]